MKKAQIDAELYLGDKHHGEVNDRRAVMDKRLAEFTGEINARVKKIVCTGDDLGCEVLSKSLGKSDEEIAEINAAEAGGFVKSLQGVMPEGGKVRVMLGNHQAEVVEGAVTRESVAVTQDRSVKKLEKYIDDEIAAEMPGVSFEVMTGIQEMDDRVVVEHGTYYDVFSTVREVLKNFDESMSLQEKFQVLNDTPEIGMALQKMW